MKQIRNRLCRCLSRLTIMACVVLCTSVCVFGEESSPLSALMSTANRMADPKPKAWSMNAIRQVDECETGTYEGNLTLTPVQSGSIQPTAPPTSTSSDGNACTYDADGRLTKDPSRGIVSIVYNEIGMPQKVLFNNGAYIGYVYLANGKKVEQTTAAAPLTFGQFSRVAPVSTIYDEAFEISLGTIQRLNVHGGHVTPRDSVFHLYIPDYQGNNVAVINTETGQAEQLTDYYPYGQPINNGLGASVNPYKYGGKELLTANGYNASDFAVRWLSHSLPGFQSPDPLAHETPWLSMYAYCAGDPINLIDPTGEASYWLHGTGSWDEQKYFDPSFRKSFQLLCGTFTPYKWSGSLFDDTFLGKPGRIDEGYRIGEIIMNDIRTKYIKNGEYNGGKLVIGGHSHGGNVGRIATKYVHDRLQELHDQGKLKNVPTINLIMINTPTILEEDAYNLTPRQAKDINTIQINAEYDITAAFGRGAATYFGLIDEILDIFSNRTWKLTKTTLSLFTNQFYKDSKVKVTYTDQIKWNQFPPGGFVNHQGNWDENLHEWFDKIKNKVE